MPDINLGPLAHGPHAALIHAIAVRCAADESIQAMWVGGSLAAGHGDAYSDVDFRIAVEPGQLDQWRNPNWAQLMPMQPCGALFMRFGEQAFLHHMILQDGTILDFYVQDTQHQNHEPQIVILACRNVAFRTLLTGFAPPVASLARDMDVAVVRQFFVEYWITTHKEMKALYRKYDHTSFVGLYLERMALLRALYMQETGRDIDSRPTLHMIGLLHKRLDGKLSARHHDMLGLPSRTPQETVVVIDAIRTEMADIGRVLAARHGFDYPHDLESVVQRTWNEHKASIITR